MPTYQHGKRVPFIDTNSTSLGLHSFPQSHTRSCSSLNSVKSTLTYTHTDLRGQKIASPIRPHHRTNTPTRLNEIEPIRSLQRAAPLSARPLSRTGGIQRSPPSPPYQLPSVLRKLDQLEAIRPIYRAPLLHAHSGVRHDERSKQRPAPPRRDSAKASRLPWMVKKTTEVSIMSEIAGASKADDQGVSVQRNMAMRDEMDIGSGGGLGRYSVRVWAEGKKEEGELEARWREVKEDAAYVLKRARERIGRIRKRAGKGRVKGAEEGSEEETLEK
ncbi:hypothetical protein DE146DRAFT_756754 [Phaeosphaeria sp. MPI-PUGE-AT-0046c]|nr:hypothetical protein DE146DRAFT_756754 [Phaeosphaeria sp. MPI-PUGE-AT-0046c]